MSTRNASFQQWQALLTNRTKRHRSGEFLVHGVRPITLAVEHGWEIRDLIYPDRRSLSAWAREMLERSGARPVAMDPALVAELADKESAELIAVVGLPAPPALAGLPAAAGRFVALPCRPCRLAGVSAGRGRVRRGAGP